MKYIVLSVEMKEIRKEFPFIFPNDLVHAEVAQRMSGMLASLGKVTVVSAGEIGSMDIATDSAGCCHGKSTSLGVVSREREDDGLLRMYDYLHGFV